MKIVIIEDEKILSQKIAKKLKNSWFSVKLYEDIESFTNNFKDKADLYIIDVLLKDWIWFTAINFIRKEKNDRSPIIMISWLDSIDNRIFSLNIGADDFLLKPFSPDELIARINAIMRRSNNEKSLESDIFYKDIIYSYQEHKVIKNWLEVHFQPKEKQIIEYFIKNKWKLIQKNDFIKDLWWEYDDLFVTNNTINVTLCKIRRKLWDDFNLETIRSEGYKLN